MSRAGGAASGAASAHIELSHITHAYRTEAGPLPVLDDLHMGVARGGFTAVVGPSGCGKSTLTRLVAGLMRPDEGEVRLGGKVVTGPRATVGMAFQNPVLLEWRSILRNVMLPLEIVATGMGASAREARTRELLALVGLEGFEDKRPSELSGGMRQRASLCRALVHRPEVLVMDEPFGALDAFTREDLWQTMARLRREEKFTALLITHDLREAVFLADEIVVLSGRPAGTQYVMPSGLPAERVIDDLYTPVATEMLAVLRREIQVAQGRLPAAPAGGAAARGIEPPAAARGLAPPAPSPPPLAGADPGDASGGDISEAKTGLAPDESLAVSEPARGGGPRGATQDGAPANPGREEAGHRTELSAPGLRPAIDGRRA